MAKTVVGLFHNVNEVEAAVRNLEFNHFNLVNVSLLAGEWIYDPGLVYAEPCPVEVLVTVSAEDERASQAAQIMKGLQRLEPVLYYAPSETVH